MNAQYKIFQTPYFQKKFKKLIPTQYHKLIKQQINTLKNHPYQGKPLSYKFIRELKIDKFRIYFAIYKEEVIVLLVTVSEKKFQKELINNIKSKRKELKEIINKIYKGENK